MLLKPAMLQLLQDKHDKTFDTARNTFLADDIFFRFFDPVLLTNFARLKMDVSQGNRSKHLMLLKPDM